MYENYIYHLNDRTMKYLMLVQSKRQHQYLNLSGKYRTSLPQEIVCPDLSIGRVDSLYFNDERLLINLEEENDEINEKTLKKFVKYLIFCSYRYSQNICRVVLCHKDPKKEFEYYQFAPSLSIKVHYIYFSQDELWNKYENVINKVKQKEKLTEMEALDIGFLSKFIQEEYASEIIDSLTNIFTEAIIDDELLKMDVGVILGGMILKHEPDLKKQNKMMERINMRHFEKEIDKLVYDEYGEELDKKDELIEAKEKQNKNTK